MKSDNFYHIEYSDYHLHLHCYTHNVSANMSFGLLQVFHAKTQEPTQKKAKGHIGENVVSITMNILISINKYLNVFSLYH